MQTISISEFRAKCAAIIKDVNKTKDVVVITRHGKPIAELIPFLTNVNRKKWLGSMKDTFDIVGDILKPAIELKDFEAHRD